MGFHSFGQVLLVFNADFYIAQNILQEGVAINSEEKNRFQNSMNDISNSKSEISKLFKTLKYVNKASQDKVRFYCINDPKYMMVYSEYFGECNVADFASRVFEDFESVVLTIQIEDNLIKIVQFLNGIKSETYEANRALFELNIVDIVNYLLKELYKKESLENCLFEKLYQVALLRAVSSLEKEPQKLLDYLSNNAELLEFWRNYN